MTDRSLLRELCNDVDVAISFPNHLVAFSLDRDARAGYARAYPTRVFSDVVRAMPHVRSEELRFVSSTGRDLGPQDPLS